MCRGQTGIKPDEVAGSWLGSSISNDHAIKIDAVQQAFTYTTTQLSWCVIHSFYSSASKPSDWVASARSTQSSGNGVPYRRSANGTTADS